MSDSTRHHAEWLSLIEVSGPFLTLPVLVRVFPQGLPKVDVKKLGRLRAAYEEWATAQEAAVPGADGIHAAWVELILREILEFDGQTLRSGDDLPTGLDVSLAEHQERLRPAMAIVEPRGRVRAGTPRLLVTVWPFDQKLDAVVPSTRWAATPVERMTQLCRSTGVRLGLVTNGKRWTVVDAPVGQTAGFASWYADLWTQEPSTLAALEAVLGVRRLFAVADTDTIEALLDESVAFQQEVTDQLGYQVRRAVEVLVQALDRADLDRKRELLRDVPPARLYDAALTVMMRLVFLFCAEERGQLLLGDETYDANYAVSTLRALLREEADHVGLEVLERRQDAWARLLAAFRGVYGGIEHEVLRLPALGGSLFDPDRFPFLEGRAPGTLWLETAASPLPIDNRTVLHLLEALQLLQMRRDAGPSEARKLSYRALDIEQVGHVYEGLLDHVAVRVDSETLGLRGSKDNQPEISIADLDRQRRKGRDDFVEFLKEQTGRSVSGLRNDLDAEIDETTGQRLLIACGNDKTLVKRVEPYHALLRQDVWGYPLVYRAESFMVTGGSERRQTGTHYTPKSLTEQIVTETLEPLVYEGPGEGKAKDAWRLRTPAELLDLKICDMAMGSAAFLVQVCRWLGERVVEAWDAAERHGSVISADGEILGTVAGHDLLPQDREERLSLARRLIAERCVYGVDINPMAVELAKLSLWLVTLARGRPFGFLDHNLRCGDSLLGITSLEQVECFHLDPAKGRALHEGLFDPKKRIQAAVGKALALRRQLRATRIVDIEDVRSMARLEAEAKHRLENPELVADVVVGAALQSEESTDDLLKGIAEDLQRALVHGGKDAEQVKRRTRELLDTDCPERLRPRQPFHWAIEFPEVFARECSGFDAIVGNPPFSGGKKLKESVGGAYREYLVRAVAEGTRGSADLVAYFFLRAHRLLRTGGTFGLIAVNTIAEGETREVGLERLIKGNAAIYSATPNKIWPGQAAVAISIVHVFKGDWAGRSTIDGTTVPTISPFLSGREEWTPRQLHCNGNMAFIGSYVLGMGFVLDAEQTSRLLGGADRNSEVVFPYLNGDDLNASPEQLASRSVINFWDWPEDKASTYPDIYEIVHERVKPERRRKRADGTYVLRKPLPERWWHYADKRPGLYHAIGRGDLFDKHPPDWHNAIKLSRVIVTARVSKYLTFSLVSSEQVFSDAIVVFASSSYHLLGLLTTAIYETWARKMSGTLETRLRFVPTDSFETFPLPSNSLDSSEVARLARELLAVRRKIMLSNRIGLTELYNQVHDPGIEMTEIVELRRCHTLLEQCVATLYGWDDLQVKHGFHVVSELPDNNRTRFTLTRESREAILGRLAVLNRERYDEEVRRGLNGAPASDAEPTRQVLKKSRAPKSRHKSLLSFDFD